MTLTAFLLAAACSGAASVTGPENPDHGSPSVSSVQMTPSSVALAVNSSAKLSVKVKSEDGKQLDRAGTWSVEDPDVVDLEGEGTERTVTVRSVGRTRVITTVAGVSDTAVVEGTEGDSPQPPSGGDGGATVLFDPDRYSSTQELMDDPYGVFSEDELGGNYSLDTEVARPGGSKSMRYDYVDQGANNAVSIGRRIPLPERVRELWIEFDVRWSDNYMCCIDMSKTETYAHKFVFGEVKTGNEKPWLTSDGQSAYRWSLHWPGGGATNPPNGQLKIESPTTTAGDQVHENIGVNAADYFDGRWHTVRIHWRHDPGLYEIWIDGRRVLSYDGFVVDPEIALTAVLLGRNKDDGNPSGTESLWWGKVSVWTTAPGW